MRQVAAPPLTLNWVHVGTTTEVQVLDFDLSASSHFFFFPHYIWDFLIRLHSAKDQRTHVASCMSAHCPHWILFFYSCNSRHDCPPFGDLLPPHGLGKHWRFWTLCDSTWDVQGSLSANDDDLSAENICSGAAGVAISCRCGLIEVKIGPLARDACKLDTAYTLNCLFSPIGLWWFVFGSLCSVYSYWESCIYFLNPGNLAFMFFHINLFSFYNPLWAADMWEARWQMLENDECWRSHLSLSLWTRQLFWFFFSSFFNFHSKSIIIIIKKKEKKWDVIFFVKIGLPCGGVQLKVEVIFC